MLRRHLARMVDVSDVLARAKKRAHRAAASAPGHKGGDLPGASTRTRYVLPSYDVLRVAVGVIKLTHAKTQPWRTVNTQNCESPFHGGLSSPTLQDFGVSFHMMFRSCFQDWVGDLL